MRVSTLEVTQGREGVPEAGAEEEVRTEDQPASPNQCWYGSGGMLSASHVENWRVFRGGGQDGGYAA